MKLLKRTILTMLILLLLTAPALSLAESDYETGDGWVYQDRELKIVTNNGLINFLYHEIDMIGNPQHKHTAADVDHGVIGKDVTNIIIDNSISDYNPSVTSVEEGNDTFIIDNGWVINKQTNTLFGAANVKQNKTRTVIDDLPTYIEHIGMYAFSDCRALIQISIPDSVIGIGESSFYGCNCLESITLPNGLTTIEIGAFDHCTKLKHINLEAAINSIGIAAFCACVNLETPSLYNTKIEAIHGNSFWGCDQFQTVEFPSTLKKIENIAFMLCERLNTLIFTSDQLVIEDGAFANCENVQKLIFTKGKPTSIGSTMFDEDGKTPDGKSFISYFYDTNGEIFPYPTLYYTAAYADEWAPNGETEWNSYQIQQISQEELDAILAEARGEAIPESTATPTPTAVATTVPEATAAAQETDEPNQAGSSTVEILLLSAIALVVAGIAVFVVARKRWTRK
ncbi:MAG TPA: leucine-rich repeat protein [Clostridia bacterium]|nr:leucine-rich repeat protein [Clostridia bacterium]